MDESWAVFTTFFLQFTNWPNKLALHFTKLESFPMNKHSSLLGPFVSYEQNAIL
jgi:hypothetical protein